MPTLNPIFFDATGSFSQQAWIDYWSGMWSAPSQPGFATLVREGIASMRVLAEQLLAQATSIGAGSSAGGDNPIDLLNEALSKLPTYANLAGMSTDGPWLTTAVVHPLLTRGDGPLLLIGRAAQTLHKYTAPKSWGEIFSETVTRPMGRLARGVGLSVVSKIVPLVLVAGLAYVLLTRKEPSS